jgi:tetratricopeptide (TPR) repeat protein
MENNQLAQLTIEDPLKIFQQAKEYIDSDFDHAISLTTIAAEIAAKKRMYALEAEILTFHARVIRLYGDPYQSLAILSKAFRVASSEVEDNHVLLAYIYREYGTIYSDSFDDFITGSEYFFKCLKLNAPEIQGVIFNNLGSNFIGIEKFDEAIRYLKKGEKISREKEDYYVLSYILENFGELYKKQKRYDLALEFFDKALSTVAIAIEKLGPNKDLFFVKTKISTELTKCYFLKGDINAAKEMVVLGKEFAIEHNFNI